MLAQTYFDDVACRVRELLGCGAALLVLDCPDVELRHPLLEWLPALEADRYFGAPRLRCLMRVEQVRALRDVACQSGRMHTLNEVLLPSGELLRQSVAIVPLERPAGLLGYILLVNAFSGEFTAGDARLLEDYLQTIIIDIERVVRVLCGQAEQHRPGGWTGAPVDALRMQQQATEATDDLKSNLISMVSHELRAPLTAIKGYAGLLQAYSVEDRLRADEQAAAITPARQQHYLDIIMEQARHLELVMGDLLDVSHIQSGKLALRFTEVDIAAVCQQVIHLTQQRIEQQSLERHTLRCEVSLEVPPVLLDAHRLQQILHNLLDNALKYSPAGGLIELWVGREYQTDNALSLREGQEGRSFAFIAIRDRGIGISPQQRARLFRPFSRLDHPAAGQVQGAGLGLYITRMLVEAMEGTIDLTSAENQGTTVMIRFPLRQRGELRQPVLANRQ